MRGGQLPFAADLHNRERAHHQLIQELSVQYHGSTKSETQERPKPQQLIQQYGRWALQDLFGQIEPDKHPRVPIVSTTSNRSDRFPVVYISQHATELFLPSGSRPL